jgi:hypothetical protein
MPSKTKLSLINPLNAELNPIRHLLALVGARHIVHVSWMRVKFGIMSEINNSPAEDYMDGTAF